MIWANIHQGSCFCEWIWVCCTSGKERTRNSCSPPPWRQQLQQPQPSPHIPAAAPQTNREHTCQWACGARQNEEYRDKGSLGEEEALAARGDHVCRSRAAGSVLTTLAESCIPPQCHHFPLLAAITTRSHKLFLAHKAKGINSAGGLQTPVQTAFGGVGIESILMLWATWRCPCSLHGDLTRWALKVLSSPIHSVLLWSLKHAGHLFGVAVCNLGDGKTARSEDITLVATWALWWAGVSLSF